MARGDEPSVASTTQLQDLPDALLVRIAAAVDSQERCARAPCLISPPTLTRPALETVYGLSDAHASDLSASRQIKLCSAVPCSSHSRYLHVYNGARDRAHR